MQYSAVVIGMKLHIRYIRTIGRNLVVDADILFVSVIRMCS